MRLLQKGMKPMWWQQHVADVAGEIDPDTGHLAYREVIVTVGRQQGKTTLTLGKMANTAIRRPGSGIAYTAQSGVEARKRLLDDFAPAILSSELEPAVDRIERRNGNEAIQFHNGSRIEVFAGTESAGHGAVLEAGVIDEAFKDIDDRREQAMLPAMLTRADAQLYIVSTQGTASSLYLNRKCDMGRAATVENTGTGVAYFEWSAGIDDDPADPETWWNCMPALGISIGTQAVEHAYKTMALPEFRRAMLNIPDSSGADTPIPVEAYQAVLDGSAAPTGQITFGIEAQIEGAAAAIVAADAAGAIEVVDYRDGITWLPDRLVEIADGQRIDRADLDVILDPRGPAARYTDVLRQHGITVHEATNLEVSRAAMQLHDRIGDRLVRIRPHEALDLAVEGAKRRWSGDVWYFARKTTVVDVAPLVAASLAAYRAAPGHTGEAEFILL